MRNKTKNKSQLTTSQNKISDQSNDCKCNEFDTTVCILFSINPFGLFDDEIFFFFYLQEIT